MDFEADATAPAPVASDALAQATAYAAELARLADEVAKAEVALRDAKATHRRMEQETLPELMRGLGLAELKLLDGSRIEVLDDVHCHISEEHRRRAHEWLRSNGFGGLVKCEVAVRFGKGEEQDAARLAGELRASTGRDVFVEEAVHVATLKSFVKEQMAAGVSVPADLFGVQPYVRAKVAPPRKPRARKAP